MQIVDQSVESIFGTSRKVEMASPLGELPVLDDAEMALLLQAVDEDAPQQRREPPASLPRAHGHATLEDDLEMLLLDGSSTPPAPTAARTTSQRSARSRQRQREELEYLRSQVRELEDQLDGLKRAGRPPSASSSPCEDGVPQPASHTWERIARHQMSAKQKAEAENVRLRGMLEGQLKIARGLEKLLRKRTSGEAIERVEDRKRTRRADSTDAQIYEQLAHNLDTRYREWAAAFAENGFASSMADLEDTRVSEDAAGVPTVEILFAKVLPFDLASTSDAVWKCSTTSYLQLTAGFYAAQQASHGLIKAQFEIPMQEPTKRQVYAWESTSVTRCSQSSYDGIKLLDHGWTIVEELRTDGSQKPSTIVQCCSRFVPDMSSVQSNSPIGMLSDVMIASYNRNYQTLCETVESILLENALGVKQEPKAW